MAVTPKALVEGTLIPSDSAGTTLYTCPTNATIIDKCTVTNLDPNPQTFTLAIVPPGGTAGDSNRIIRLKTLQYRECYTCPEIVGQILNTGDFVSAYSTLATALSIRISGREVT